MTDSQASTTAVATPLSVASRSYSRMANVQTVSNLASGGSFTPIVLPPTGWVRNIEIYVNATATFASGAAIVNGDGPFRLIPKVYLTDASGNPIVTAISAYNLYLLNKNFPSGGYFSDVPEPWYSPTSGPASQYTYTGSGTTGTAIFRVRIDMELDSGTTYGSIPNMDANATPLLNMDYSIYSTTWTGTTPSAASITVRVSQNYWSPTPGALQGKAVMSAPPAAGTYIENRYETATASAGSENIITTNSGKGGFLQGALIISRNAGVRTAITAASNFTVMLDNQPFQDNVPIEEWMANYRRYSGYCGNDIAQDYTSGTIFTPGTAAGAEVGVIPVIFSMWNEWRDTWLSTRAGSLLQYKFTPGASATGVEILSRILMTDNADAFYARF